jgi:hypothetical protein
VEKLWKSPLTENWKGVKIYLFSEVVAFFTLKLKKKQPNKLLEN